MILVAGATGNVGGELVRALAAAGEPVRALTRGQAPQAPRTSQVSASAFSARGTFPPRVETVTGDLNDPDSMRDALTGATGMFLLSGYQNMPGTLAQANRAGVRHIVLLSGSSAGSGDMSNAISRYMIESETAVRESGLAWTILRPFGFMSNALQWVPQLRGGDVVRAPWATVRVAVIDPYDIAAVAALALTSGGHEDQCYTLSGPEPMLPGERVRVLGEVLGRDLRFEGQPDDEARAEMSKAMPARYVEAFFSFYGDGTLDESRALPTVRDVTGRPPRTFRRWAREHAGAFR
ncbi:MAG: NmrA family NAD(P)-binding protein [Streptosporangiaceae bacterium]|nr:NmrA family NAD(P)-binding protein [Streptosporangiaceae bacterium]MBV9856936.1 NmrA family NAD(P)-binding protein [Streptosporangiaceae bacterium]